MLDVKASYEEMRNNVGAVWLRREVISATGPEVEVYLQGQLSQDVQKIDVGGSAWSFILQPHGKVDALIRLTRVAQDRFIIDVDRGYGDHVLARLERFKLRTKVDFESLDWKVLGLRGPASKDIELLVGESDVISDGSWPELLGTDILGSAPEVPAGVELCHAEAYEVLRIEAGIPEMGCEIDEKTIPAEAGINNRTISFNKGCYTGQELVARIDSRGGNVPRNLRGVVVRGAETPYIGSKIVAISDSGSKGALSAKPFGVISSVSFSPRLNAPVALAMIRRDVSLPARAMVVWDEGSSECEIYQLPLTNVS